MSSDIHGSCHLYWHYPKIYRSEKPDHLTIHLVQVRAADAIRIRYDAERDGWAIEQPKRTRWRLDEPEGQGWTETAFLEAWAINEDPEEP